MDNKILPVIHRDGSVKWGPNVWETERWGLPTDGATIPVWSRGARLGRFVLKAPLAVPYTSAELAQAVALVDQAGAAPFAARPTPSQRTALTLEPVLDPCRQRSYRT